MDGLTKREETHRHRERAYGCQQEGTARESGTGTHTLLYLKWITNRTHCAARETLLLLCGGLEGRRVWGRADTCICMAESLRCSPETVPTLSTGYPPVQNEKFKKMQKYTYKYGCLFGDLEHGSGGAPQAG